MGFLSTLAKIGLGVAAPFTGGLSALAIPAVDAIGNAVGGAGSAVGAANTAAGNNRQTATQNSLEANRQNISGQSSYENALMARAKEDADQRRQALKDIYASSFAQNFKGSPYNPAGVTKQSPEYLAALKNLETQGTARIAQPSSYNLNTTAPLATYNPIDIKDVAGATGNSQSFLSKLGSWAGPALTIGGNLMKQMPKSQPQAPGSSQSIDDSDYFNAQNGGGGGDYSGTYGGDWGG
jgi:hypothetical protein